jgi:hypothetical protein
MTRVQAEIGLDLLLGRNTEGHSGGLALRLAVDTKSRPKQGGRKNEK